MSKSKNAKERNEGKAQKRRDKRRERDAYSPRQKGGQTRYGIVMAGSRPGYDALVHPSLEDEKVAGIFLTPVATTLEMTTAGGPAAMLPRVKELVELPIVFVLGAHKDRPGKWQLLLGGKKSGGPLRPSREGECYLDGSYGPPETFLYLVDIMTAVAEDYERPAATVASDIIDAVVGQAVQKWDSWRGWAKESRPDILDFAAHVEL